MSKLIGLESEYLLPRHDIAEVLALRIPEVHSEFFRCMVEVVTDPHPTAVAAVAQLASGVNRLRSAGIQLGHYASFPTARSAPTMADVTTDTPYYRWVFYEACRRAGHHPVTLRHVGVHINLSDTDMNEDELIRATNFLRCYSFLFVLLTANSPFALGAPCGALSYRMCGFPNRYDPPFWQSAESCREWLTAEEAAGRIYPGKARCWMTVCPRLPQNDLGRPFERIEIRTLDGGLGVPLPVIEGCCELAQRLMQHGHRVTELPAKRRELQHNDVRCASQGRRALLLLRNQLVPAIDIARHWCAGIPALEDVLENGCPAERALARLHRGT